ncbi:FAD/NAD(P)-binding domain-containing protein [Penicillium argentinense]|uniref:FAD/NAD(P)-binding domain-containing protein n=1 Tax=Penicillium argentinense TaxID=1131581 RepID=A0A9W9K9Y4_9EURO|nr:FAD/NAD(P)-binding domain-containing protein [Penicillium argentinense]KAJ5098549.1 FAD/NAD(P)-binding domain-containing protein [Penicillium argentinense]
MKWSSGPVVGVGDAVHPVSPYAAYGMGIALENGSFLARALDGVDLCAQRAANARFEIYEKERVDYANHNFEFAPVPGEGVPFYFRDFWPIFAI